MEEYVMKREKRLDYVVYNVFFNVLFCNVFNIFFNILFCKDNWYENM